MRQAVSLVDFLYVELEHIESEKKILLFKIINSIQVFLAIGRGYVRTASRGVKDFVTVD